MATFKERANGHVQVVIRKKGYPVQSKTFRTKTEAQAWATVTEGEMLKGIHLSVAEAERTTLSEVIERFEKEFAPHHYRPRADKKEAWRFQCKHLATGMGAYSLVAIDQRLVAKYRDERLKAVNETTVRKELYMLSKVLEFAQGECGLVLPHGNPVDRVRKPTEKGARDRRLSNEEWSALERECRRSRNPYLWPAVQVAVETAMRQGEMLGMNWKQVDLKRRIVLLPKTKNGEARAVPLTSKAVAVLEAMPRAIAGQVFPVQRMTLYHAFIAACKRAGIEGYTWHDLRHEALSRLAERGDLSVLELAAVSGHKTLQMLKRYTHLQAENLARKLG